MSAWILPLRGTVDVVDEVVAASSLVIASLPALWQLTEWVVVRLVEEALVPLLHGLHAARLPLLMS